MEFRYVPLLCRWSCALCSTYTKQHRLYASAPPLLVLLYNQPGLSSKLSVLRYVHAFTLHAGCGYRSPPCPPPPLACSRPSFAPHFGAISVLCRWLRWHRSPGWARIASARRRSVPPQWHHPTPATATAAALALAPPKRRRGPPLLAWRVLGCSPRLCPGCSTCTTTRGLSLGCASRSPPLLQLLLAGTGVEGRARTNRQAEMMIMMMMVVVVMVMAVTMLERRAGVTATCRTRRRKPVKVSCLSVCRSVGSLPWRTLCIRRAFEAAPCV